MPDKLFKIVLRGDIGDFQAKMAAAGKSVGAITDKATAADAKSAKFRDSLSSVGDAAGKMGLVAAAGLGAVVAVTANFDQQMSKVEAATHESADAMGELRAAAIKAGADTAFSAGEAAQGIEALAKSGVSTRDILGGGLQGALDLAAAGTLEVGDAAEAAATAMTQFGLSGKDVPHIADLLSAAAGKAQGEVSDMNMALAQGGLVANQMGLSIEETVGTLAAFASAGLMGSDAGTSLKTMLLKLQAPVGTAAKEMDKLNLTAYDAQGNFIGMSKFAGELRGKLKDMTSEQRNASLATIFGSDAVRAASIIYEQGAVGIADWIKQVNDQGHAAETAALKLDNLRGDIENFTGALESFLIGAGEGAQGPLRNLVQGATQGTKALNKLSPQVKNTGTALLALTAVTGGALWFGTKAIAAVASMRTAMVGLGLASTATAFSLSGVALAAGVVAGITFVGLGTLEMMDSAKRGREAVDAQAKSVKDLEEVLRASNVGKYADDLGIDVNKFATDLFAFGPKGEYAAKVIKQLEDSGHGLGPMFKAMGGSIIPGFTNKTEKSSDALDDMNEILRNSKGLLGQGAGDMTNLSMATTKETAALDLNTDGIIDNTDKQLASTQAVEDAILAREALTDANTAALGGEIAYEAAIDAGSDRLKERAEIQQRIRDKEREVAGAKTPEARAQARAELAALRQELKGYTLNLDTNTAAGRANAGILNDQAKAWNGLNARQQNAPGAYKRAREALINQAIAFGATRKQAKRYADQLLDIPPRVTTKLELNKQRANEGLSAYIARLNKLDGRRVKTYVDALNTTYTTDGKGTGTFGHLAAGGPVFGPGTATSDSIPAMLSAGEFVVKTAAVNKYGIDLLHRINSMRLADGGHVDHRAQRAQTRGYAAGGPVITRVAAGLSDGDVGRIAKGLASVRPLYGDVNLSPHDYSEFKREMHRDQVASAGGGVSF